jgi:hypothetical protein
MDPIGALFVPPMVPRLYGKSANSNIQISSDITKLQRMNLSWQLGDETPLGVPN